LLSYGKNALSRCKRLHSGSKVVELGTPEYCHFDRRNIFGSLETKTSNGNAVLHDLIETGFLDNLDWAIENTSDLTSKKKDGYTPLDMAKKLGSPALERIQKALNAKRK
jgi:hypothetical protein